MNEEKKAAPEFTVYAAGIVSASVCTSLPPEEISVRMNMLYPTGISSNWGLAEEPHFSGGEPNPCQCPDHPDTHKHYLLHC